MNQTQENLAYIERIRETTDYLRSIGITVENTSEQSNGVKALKERAHAVGHEWIVDRDGDVCFRRMLFDEEGRREVRYWPDPCEFRPLAEAIAKLTVCEMEGLQ